MRAVSRAASATLQACFLKKTAFL